MDGSVKPGYLWGHATHRASSPTAARQGTNTRTPEPRSGGRSCWTPTASSSTSTPPATARSWCTTTPSFPASGPIARLTRGGGPAGPDPQRRDAPAAAGSAGAGGRSRRLGGGEEPARACTTRRCSRCSTRARRRERYAVHSFDHRIVRRLGEQRPALRRGHPALGLPRRSGRAPCERSARRRCGRSGSRWTRSWCTRCTPPAAPIIAWTVNEVGDLERLARLGVDGLCGNYPDRIRVALAARVDRPRGSEPA